jgi:hypothetical protein
MNDRTSIADARTYFAMKLAGMAGNPHRYFAEKYGLSYGAVRDQIQGRVLPSRAMIVLMHAIETDPRWMIDIAKAAKDDLAFLDAIRGKSGRSVILTGE